MDFLPLIGAFFTATIAGFIGTNAGGAGLLTVPALLLLGLPPHIAVGSSRVGSLGAMPTGIYVFARHGSIDYRLGCAALVLSAFGAYAGSHVLLATPDDLLKRLLGVFILLVLVMGFVQRRHGVHPLPHASLPWRVLGYGSFAATGFLAAYLGGGAGILDRFTLVFVFGKTLLQSAGVRKISSLGMSITASVVYIRSGVVDWPFALAMMAGMAIGVYAGSVMGLRKGNEWVRPLFVGMTALSAALLLVR